jgi:hypothetical protein
MKIEKEETIFKEMLDKDIITETKDFLENGESI